MQNDDIKPYWDADVRPHYYTRSDVGYIRTNMLEHLYKRGVINTALINMMKILPPGAFIAGGFVASMIRGPTQLPSDIDIFFSSAEAFRKTYDLISNPPPGIDAEVFRGYKSNVGPEELSTMSQKLRLVKFVHTDPAKLPIQLIKMVWYNDAEGVIDSFDFTVTQFVVDGTDLVFNPLSLIDLFKNRLVLHRYQYPVEMLYRIVKYAKKGYDISHLSMREMANGIRECKDMDPIDSTLSSMY